MPDTPDPLLAAIETISEGQPVDWAALESMATTESFRQRLDELKIIAGVADLARETPPDRRRQTSGGEPGTATTPVESASIVWGHLQIREQVGRGAFGEVYKAWDTKLEREVALKLLRASDLPEDRSRDAIEEGRLLARVRHPNVVTVYGADRVGDSTGVWMEFVSGRSLDQIVRKSGPLDPAAVVAIAIDVCRALDAVHAVGLLHRDIKAPNVVRADDGRIVLMDFGSVVEHEHGSTDDASIAGTPLYLAPEVLAGAKPTVRSDIYAVGVLLYHLVTGAFPARATTFDEVRRLVTAGQIVPLSQARPDLPDGLVRVIERAMAHEPGDRFESATAMETALVQLQAQTGGWKSSLMLGGVMLAAVVGLGLAWLSTDWFSSPRPTIVNRQLQADAGAFGRVTTDGRHQACIDYTSMDVAICELESGGQARITSAVRAGFQRGSAQGVTVISPSGRRVAYLWNRYDPAGNLSIELRVSLEGGRGFLPLLRWAPTGGAPSASPLDWTVDETKLLVAVHEDGEPGSLELVDASSTRRQRLTSFSGSVDGARFSADGRYLAYDNRTMGRPGDIRILDLESGNTTDVVTHPSNDYGPVWTPSGDGIVFTSDRDGTMGLWRLPVRAGLPDGEPELLHGFGREPLVRALGFRGVDALLYWASTGGLDVYTAPIDLDRQTVGPANRASRDPLANTSGPAWSPDGRRLAFIASREQGGTSRAAHVIVQDTDTGELLMQTEAPGRGQHYQQSLDWTADGTALIVRAARALTFVDATTGEVRRRLEDPFSSPRFRRMSDGRSVVGIARREVRRISTASGEVEVLGRLPALGPLESDSLVLSPDETTFAATFGPVPSGTGNYRHVVGRLDGGGEQLVETTERRCSVQAWIDDVLLLSCRLVDPSRFDWSDGLFVLPTSGGTPFRLGLDLPQIIGVRAHPSGRRVAFSAGEDNSEVWMLEHLPPLRRR